MHQDTANETIVSKIEENLNNGVLVWQQPWSKNGLTEPTNAVTCRPYQGINHLSLNMYAVLAGHATNLWLTYKQAEEAGGHVRKGEKSYPALRPIEIKKGFNDAADKAGEEEAQRLLLFKGYALFNLDQTEGLDHLRPADTEAATAPSQRIPEIDDAVAATKADIRYGGDSCYYRPATDHIQMVEPDRFISIDGKDPIFSFYNVLGHELIHWTGGSVRLNRIGKTPPKLAEYAYEELVAEIGSMMFCQHFGIDGLDRHNAAYIQSWLKGLKDDRRLLMKAAGDAQRGWQLIKPPSPTPAP